jgi:SAM-dependent methyltransferase
LLTFEAQIPAATLLTPDPLMVHLGAEDDPVGHEVRGSVLNTLQPKSMVKYRRGHGCGLLRIVRLASNKNGTLPCPFLFFNYPGTRLPEDPEELGREHYFSVGASALNVINSVLALAEVDSPKTILDFGCGAGRVTRWLRAAFPQASISACDVREDDLAFVRNKLGASTWVSGTDVGNLQQPFPFPLDLIWVGSVVTHLDEATSEALLCKLAEWLKPRGLLIASLHGRTAWYIQE